MCDVGHVVRATRRFARLIHGASRQSVGVWFLLGLTTGAVVYGIGGMRLRDGARHRTMSDRAALGYRAALGENPMTLRMRRSSEDV